jgi:hypothetical protein
MLILEVFNERLTSSLLQPSLFDRLVELKTVNTFKSIQVGLLSEFKRLKVIDLFVSKEFFHFDTTRWMLDLNAKVKWVNLTNLTQVKENIHAFMLIRFIYKNKFVSFDQMYEYPLEDICLFKYFPHSHLVYPLIVPGKRLKCTCTLKWLQLYGHLFEEKINTTRDYELFVNTRHYGHDILEYDEISYVFCGEVECDFENIFKKCTLNESTSSSRASSSSNGRHLSDVDVYLTIKWFQYILLTILKVNFFFF